MGTREVGVLSAKKVERVKKRGRYADGERAETLAARWKTRPDAMRQKLLRLRLVVKGCVERRMGGSWA